MARIEEHWHTAFAVAYRILGLPWQAEDVAQDTMEAMLSRPHPDIRNLGAYVGGTAAKLALNRLRSDTRLAKRHARFGLPAALDENHVTTTDARIDLGYAVTAMGLRLSPLMRAVFVLRSGFDMPYSQISNSLNCTEAAARQAFSRACRKMVETPLPPTQPAASTEELARFVALVTAGDADALAQSLAEEIALHSDGGAQAPAFGKTITGRSRIAGFLVVSPPLLGSGLQVGFTTGLSGPLLHLRGKDNLSKLIVSAQVSNGRLTRNFALSNPEKLDPKQQQKAAF
ncbi:hypothetical protein ACMU_07365 [Actibacterium mucosum KCTC 23349]|uniref:RNA polymerase sigma-70 region 2 domain-containing protein n=1 Tax=Actibacterium mucosum KCTC 23349 TaxID=1454373 RepID=A0A037ZKX1_9RHOB|nr:sigma factor-like helix-turn-helix DNA-binding protein [Actibacterium mucosum]KAJ56748.1 hypothetical protein ACMU_07365 [Actibacterium mucosum KCTC 23349]